MSDTVVLVKEIANLSDKESKIALSILEAKPDAPIDTVISEAKEQAKSKAKPEYRVRDLTEGYGLMANMSALNLGRLFSTLVDPDRHMTDAQKALAEHCMHSVAAGAKTSNNPRYKHKGEAKPDVKKSHQHSGTQPWKNRRKKRLEKQEKRHGFPSSLRPKFDTSR